MDAKLRYEKELVAYERAMETWRIRSRKVLLDAVWDIDQGKPVNYGTKGAFVQLPTPPKEPPDPTVKYTEELRLLEISAPTTLELNHQEPLLKYLL